MRNLFWSGDKNATLDKSPEKLYENKTPDKKVLNCWKCSNIIYANSSDEITQCINCGKYNRVPQNNINVFRNYRGSMPRNSIKKLQLENDVTHPYSDLMLVCQFCDTKNLFRRDADKFICYKCGKTIKSLNNINSEIYDDTDDKKIVGWKLVPHQTLVPQPATPYTPRYNSESNTDYILKKILKTMKKQKKANESNLYKSLDYNPFIFQPYPQFIPYPIGIKYKDQDDDIIRRSVNYKIISPIKEIESIPKNGYKITIRKKKSNGKDSSKKTIFEKVFYFK